MRQNEPAISIDLVCQGCDFVAVAVTGTINNFDEGIRAAATHVRRTGHEVHANGRVFPWVSKQEKQG